MNAVEIEEAVSDLSQEPFDAAEFPFSFLAAFGNKEATIKRLRSGNTNKSDVGGVLQRNNIHIAVAEPGQTVETLARLKASPQTERQKAKFILATDGAQLEAEELGSGEVLSCRYGDLGNNFGFFLPLAGISTVAEVKNNPIDIKATSRLNRLYVQLLKDNADWGSPDKRGDLNRFMARMIFCFFAEDTGIFQGDDLFTSTVQTMTEADGSNTRDVLLRLFDAMNTRAPDGAARPGFPSWADRFPYVNGGLFADDIGCPTFSRTSRAYLLRAGELDWKTINPDIFGSMIQAVADEDERGELGMHYTSVPNIQKVLDPLFLDDLREQLEQAGTNKRMLFNLRQRLSRIRVFDPACGSGNFLVIAYIRMREIEDEIMRRRGEALTRSAISLTQFFGIEIKSFAAEIARLSLLIAEFQCDVRFIGQAEARALVLPLHATGNIRQGNALRIDWEEVCPPATVSAEERDLGGPTGRLNLEGGSEEREIYICGNPPYQGSVNQSQAQKADMESIFKKYLKTYKDLDYVSSWFVRAAEYLKGRSGVAAFVSTNSICQGEQVAMLWPILFKLGLEIDFAHTSFLWKNNASNNAGVTCIVVGIGNLTRQKLLFEGSEVRAALGITPYLTIGERVIVRKQTSPLSPIAKMQSGNKPTDNGNFILDGEDKRSLVRSFPETERLFRRFVGSRELTQGGDRYCLWIKDNDLAVASANPEIGNRISNVRAFRLESRGKQANENAETPHRFVFSPHTGGSCIAVSNVSSERREYLPANYFSGDTVVSNLASVAYDAPLWNFSIIVSKLHLAWIATICGKLKTDYRYSNTLGWNTFPVPKLTATDKARLTRCAADILLAREAHFPATIAELYDPEMMPTDLRAAHDCNDETLERIYIGRRFRNDTERLEKLFEMYTKMTTKKERAN
ncbi:class I SAM-dependent DNA methyltransferase [Pseudohoeflea suaedae]|uniref:site-specific DNA-methyltransferase (adenine-specific) n=1 Tax=Pseudohoeflea suaedae TaxID=877384 RepID=A0A4R5PIK0_9HYPH|nr:DNA methyltransferase [Pseudohoeflea suaedae]TDH35063.1 class I SAM-dependent DNA methyltransferase [Pseudohoeflea suaedae]